jgi:formylglycine-generating enzyme required for sulfatase activity
MSDIFISYKREEQPQARKLADALQRRGWSVWWDPKLRAGEHFDDAIERALNDASCVIVIWSKLSVNSKYVKDEATYALNRNKLVPIAIEEVDLPFRFEGIQTGQLFDWDGSDGFPEYEKLVTDIMSILGTPPTELEERNRNNTEMEIKPDKSESVKIITPESAAVAEKPAITALKARRQKKLTLGILGIALIVASIFIGWFNFLKPKYAQTIQNSIGMEFVLISAGSYSMGSSPGTRGETSERPSHTVKISRPFYLQNTEVTQRQWKEVMGNNPSIFKECGDDCPVEIVSWWEAHRFIKKLNTMEGHEAYRLPTEAEWEYACRAGTTTHFSFGDEASKLAEYAWYKDNSSGRTHPVGGKKPNAWGLYDMHGNNWEWVEDDWHKDYSGAPDDGRAWLDEHRADRRVIRGGSWHFDAYYCRSAYRNAEYARNGLDWIGFRLARSVSLGP